MSRLLLLLPLLITVSTKRYILFGVNPGEGFNLRRDVYIRMAALVNTLPLEWHLVLAPWPRLYHWHNTPAGTTVPWERFFDLRELKKWTRVLSFQDYVRKTGSGGVELLLYLEGFEVVFNEEGEFVEEYEVQEKCSSKVPWKYHNGHVTNRSYKVLHADTLECMYIRGKSVLLVYYLTSISHSSVYIDRCECLLHSNYFAKGYWDIRRSMVFAPHLVSTAMRFIGHNLAMHNNTSANTHDNVSKYTIPEYISAHLRRGDFAASRPSWVPSLRYAAEVLSDISDKRGVPTIFIATDAIQSEKDELQSYLESKNVVFYTASKELLDGEVAIIDQIICSYSTYFIGTKESTFSYRIHEERLIMGKSPDSTYNSFCNDASPGCTQPTRRNML